VLNRGLLNIFATFTAELWLLTIIYLSALKGNPVLRF